MNTICIVEDEMIIAKDLQLFLNDHGYNCSIARNYVSVLYAARIFKPNYFIMDINLSEGIDGI